MDHSNVTNITLNNGITMPVIGFGTYQIPDGVQTEAAVDTAIRIGYRHLDCASAYANQASVGKGIKKSGINRSDLFITSKVWVTDMAPEATAAAFEKTLSELDTDYLDLYIIHWPKPNSRECYQILEELYMRKKVRAIGISNFKPHHIEEMIKNEPVMPAVNQVEYHPYLPQDETQTYCEALGIRLTSHSPFMEGRMFKVPQLEEIARKHKKSVAQIVLRWDLQRGVITIPKSVTPWRMEENMHIFDFELDSEDMQLIASLNTGERSAPDPDNMPF